MEKKHWWGPLILGIILLALGIVIFIFPQTSYITLSLLFGIVIMVSGLIYIGMGTSKEVKGRGWLIVAGIAEIIVGLALTFMPEISALTLPLFLGFWLLFKGFTLIGIGYKVLKEKIPGWGWTFFSALMLIFCGIIILMQPFFFGIEAVLLWCGVSLIIGGCTLMNYSFKLMN